ncbi:hypothetical protein Rs2_46829 [Raphanus sativus]|nr:hypothetical protein Rs2_46829 [Raphanus sativus]
MKILKIHCTNVSGVVLANVPRINDYDLKEDRCTDHNHKDVVVKYPLEHIDFFHPPRAYLVKHLQFSDQKSHVKIQSRIGRLWFSLFLLPDRRRKLKIRVFNLRVESGPSRPKHRLPFGLEKPNDYETDTQSVLELFPHGVSDKVPSPSNGQPFHQLIIRRLRSQSKSSKRVHDHVHPQQLTAGKGALTVKQAEEKLTISATTLTVSGRKRLLLRVGLGGRCF